VKLADIKTMSAFEEKMGEDESRLTVRMIAVFAGVALGIIVNTRRIFRQISNVRSRFSEFYENHPRYATTSIVVASCIAGGGFEWMRSVYFISMPSGMFEWMRTVMMVMIWSECFMTLISILIAVYRRRANDTRPRVLKKRDLISVDAVGTVDDVLLLSKRSKVCRRACKPPQVIRWDIFGVFLSSLFGKMASIPLPRCLRAPYFRMYARRTGANLNEIEGKLEDFSSLRAFFTRRLKAGSRPVSRSVLVSPVDGEVVVFGQIHGDRIEQVKGATYSMSQFLGADLGFDVEDVRKRSNGQRAVFHIVIYLNPGDYHRLHSPCAMKIHRLRHFPGTLFPISPVVSRMIPDLFALNERVVLHGKWRFGNFAYAAVGAYNVGSISVNFDERIRTNRLRRDFRNPNLCIKRDRDGFSRRDIGKFAYESEYDPPVPMKKAEELGTFNLGSTVVLIFEAPVGFEFRVNVGDKLRLGETLGKVSRTVKRSAGSRTSETKSSRSPGARRRSRTPNRRHRQ